MVRERVALDNPLIYGAVKDFFIVLLYARDGAYLYAPMGAYKRKPVHPHRGTKA